MKEGVSVRKVLPIFLLFFLAFAAAPADTPPTGSGFYVLMAHGPCLLYDAGKNVKYQGGAEALEGKEIPLGDTLDTGDDAVVILLHYPDMSRMTVNEKSSFQVKDPHSLWLTLGKVWVKISHLFTQPTDFQVESPNAVAIAHGTEFAVSQDAQGGPAAVHVFEGTVEVSNGSKLPPVSLSAGHFVEGVRQGQILKPLPFNLKTIQDPWWRWNLDKEERFHQFFTSHQEEIQRLLKGREMPVRKLARLRAFMRKNGIDRKSFRALYRRYKGSIPPGWRLRERIQRRRRMRPRTPPTGPAVRKNIKENQREPGQKRNPIFHPR